MARRRSSKFVPPYQPASPNPAPAYQMPTANPVQAPKPAVPAAPLAVSRMETKGSGTSFTPRAAAPAAAPVARPTHQQIAERAYQIYLKRGRGPGNAIADWLEAERQLRAGL